MANHDKDIKYVGDSRVPAQKHSITAPSYSIFPGKTEAFYPNFLLKEWMVGAVVLIGFLVLTVVHPAPIGDKADPTNTSFVPLPDWYFLFLYQMLKYPWASGDLVVIGTVVVPGLAFGALLLAPFLDRSPERRAYRRPIASGLMIFAIIGVFYLSWAAMAQHNAESGGNQAGEGQSPPPALEEKNDQQQEAQSPGDKIWAQQKNCQGCHGNNMQGGFGPSLQHIGAKYSKEELKKIVKEGVPPKMPAGQFTGSDAQLDQFVEYLAGLK